MEAFTQTAAPLGSLTLSALVALLPLLTVFFLLGVVHMNAHWAGVCGVVVALAVAIFAFRMPAGMALSAGLEGAVFGIFPITWIVLTAIILFELTVASGHHDTLMQAFARLSPDPRALGIFIAFSFCALLEALAGFGAPVAICGVMLLALGFAPWKAALTVLVGNTFAVPYGAMATPVLTGANLTGIDAATLSAQISEQTSVLVWLIPFALLLIMDGWRGLAQVWPLALAVGASYALSTWLAARTLAPGLVNMVPALVSLAVGIALLRIWQPRGSRAAAERLTGAAPQPATERIRPAALAWAIFPYVLIVAVFVTTQMVPVIRSALAATNVTIHWPALWAGGENLVRAADGTPAASSTYTFAWLSSPGTLLLLTALVLAACYRMRPGAVARLMFAQVYKLRWTFLTIGSVLALAYVMNLSGQTLTIGTWIAGAGSVFPFLAPILGWIGTAVTGSGTSTTALFANLQHTAATQIGADPGLLVACNTVGGAVGKMISPQTLAIATGGVDMVGEESVLLRKSLPWACGLLILLCLLVGFLA
ncbi:L-lactate permease [Actinotignum sp. GS-2025b]|uniref:L-lactate permease n=1 Tax=Actinotignum sp. GS-2025b TaxID=3427275 RepID=UPI003F466A7A